MKVSVTIFTNGAASIKNKAVSTISKFSQLAFGRCYLLCYSSREPSLKRQRYLEASKIKDNPTLIEIRSLVPFLSLQ